VNSVNPAAPILSLEATDDSTIVIKLKAPTASILAGLSSQLQGQFFILPREAEGGFDVAKDPHGAGAYFLEEYIPSSRLVYSRNPNSYDKRSYPDKIETPIITESAQVVAQIIAGNILTHYTPFPPDTVLQIKKDQEKIAMYQRPIGPVGATTFFGFKADPADKTPFRDERVRQAWARSMDRDLFLETFANVDKFGAEGLPVDTKWNSAMLPSDYAGWFLDPQGSDFGENAKFYEFDLTEAKALLSAAGFPDGIDIVSNEAAGTNYGLTYAPQVEVLLGFAAEAGFRAERLQHQAPAPWNPDFRDSHGFFEGVAFRLTPVPSEPRDGLFAVYNVNGSLNYGFDPDGTGSTSKTDSPGDPYVDETTTKLRQTFDSDEAIALAHELQQYLGGKQYFSRALGSATGFNVAWPSVKNFETFQGLSWGYLWKEYWVDETLPPFV
jgi:ABC-type transport system substrate-binding protein